MSQNKSSAVMARRTEAPDSLDFFPTPPWATRALLEHVLDLGSGTVAWEPAAGEGHMAEVLREYFPKVYASDVHDYGKGYSLGSFVGEGLDRATCPSQPDWIITNPPFNLAEEFLARALEEARVGVAMLLRTAWIEGQDRYRSIFQKMPPSKMAVFSERVAMQKGLWDPKASSATCYAWFVWQRSFEGRTELAWIPPGQRERLTKVDDAARFCKVADMPLFNGEAA